MVDHHGDMVAQLAGVLVTTVGQSYGAINVANVARAHETLEGRSAIGRIVLSGF